MREKDKRLHGLNASLDKRGGDFPEYQISYHSYFFFYSKGGSRNWHQYGMFFVLNFAKAGIKEPQTEK